MKNYHNAKNARIDGGHIPQHLKNILICSALTFCAGLSFGIAIMQIVR